MYIYQGTYLKEVLARVKYKWVWIISCIILSYSTKNKAILIYALLVALSNIITRNSNYFKNILKFILPLNHVRSFLLRYVCVQLLNYYIIYG